jgi:peptide/nickel transport system substrate-binding protein
MEGEGSKSLPQEGSPKGSSTKLIAAIIVVVLVVAAIGGALLLMGGGKGETNKAPTVTLAALSENINIGDSVTVRCTATDTDGTIASYVWNFGDNVMKTTATNTTSHTYYVPGQYLVTVTAVDDKNGSGTSWDSAGSVEVNPPAISGTPGASTSPVAIVATSAKIIKSGEKIDFDGKSSFAYVDGDTQPLAGAHVSKMVWTFGDGNTLVDTYANAKVCNHTYVAPTGAAFTVGLTVIASTGLVGSTSVTIVVTPDVVTPGGVKYPNTYTLTTFGEPQSFDPAWDYESAGGQVLQNCYEQLIGYNQGNVTDLVPELATKIPTLANGGISSDGKNYTFEIRTGVTFHDGATMNGTDVIYSIERVLRMNDIEGAAAMLAQLMIPGWAGLGTPVTPAVWAKINASMTLNSEFNVTIHLIQPFGGFLNVLAYTVASVVSKEYVEAHGGVHNNERNEVMNRNIMGTGPFKMTEWAPNQFIRLQRFDNYRLGAAPLKYVVIKKVQDLGTREMLIRSGESDSTVVPVMNSQDVIGKPGLRTYEMLPQLSVTFFGLNQAINKSAGFDVGNVPATFFADKFVRQAFNNAFDYGSFIATVSKNTSVQPNGAIPPQLFGYDPTVPKYKFNLTACAASLKQALDTRPGAAAGSTYADNGFSIVLYYNAGNLARQAGCQLLERGLTALSQNASMGVAGVIHVSAQALDWPAYLAARAASALPIFYMGWGADFPDPDNFITPMYHATAGTFPVVLGLNNASLTHLVEQAAAELNKTIRAQLYSEISWSAYENAYYLYVAWPTAFHVERTWVHGFYSSPLFSDLPGDFYPLSKS